MKNKLLLVITTCLVFLMTACETKHPPLKLNSENPHYFDFRGKPAVLIGSTEHYGAVLNLDFDYITYLDELAASGLNVTRTFSGIYLEPQGVFRIAKNTLAPAQEKLICPWARSSLPGYPGGGNKFDISKWDEAYFMRLKDFITEAGKRDIVVELDLFSNFYDTLQWKLSPVYFKNNINNVTQVLDQKEVLSLRHPEILEIQEEMVRKIITELNPFDNLYYEVCNEPYFGDLQALDAWEKHMTNVVAQAEEELPYKHLISQNIQNGSMKIENPHPAVSIFNFHYAKPPVAVDMNYGLNKPIGDNETGFNGTEDVRYRTEAWDFMTAGGALFNNLDYSFTVDNEDGSFVFPKTQPGGGGKTLRSQFKTLTEIFREIDFIHMMPSNSILKVSPDTLATGRVLANEGKQYLLYLRKSKPAGNRSSTSREAASSEAKADSVQGTDQVNKNVLSVSLDLPAGDYNCEWIDPVTGNRTPFPLKGHTGGSFSIRVPCLDEDLVLKISK